MSRKIVEGPANIHQWANDAFHYGEVHDVSIAQTEWEDQSRPTDFSCLIAFAHLVLSMEKCAVSTAEVNIKKACEQYKVAESFGCKNTRWQYLLQDFPFSAIAQAGKDIENQNWVSAHARKTGDGLAEKMNAMVDSHELGKIVSQFITMSRDDELSVSNQTTICRIFRQAIEAYDWKKFKTGKDLL